MSIGLVACFLAVCLATTASAHEMPAGFLTEPRSGHGRGVLVLHAWWGLNADVKAFCKRLADAGFVAFAPDLFHGKVVKTKAEAEALVNEYEPKYTELQAQIAHAAADLSKRSGGKEIAVVGFSFGAYYALHLSNAEPKLIRATVVYYGTGQQDFKNSKSSYLGHFAEKDPFEPKKNVEQLRKLLQEAGRPASLYTYPGTGHWFSEPSVGEAYDKAAAESAWERTLAFLRKALGADPG